MMLVHALGLEKARLVSICGAGGKTTLMLAVAREFLSAGERVLLTTTTKIAKEEAAGPWPVFATAGAEQILENTRRAWQKQGRGRAGAVIAFSRESGDRKKLIGFSPEIVDRLKDDAYFDRILVEADGSAGKPLKAPASHEPVIPSATDVLVIVAGLNGLGLPLDEENLFRPHIWAKLTGIALGSRVSADSLVQVVMHEDGLAKGCPEHAAKTLFLNRADNPQRLSQAKLVVQSLAAVPGRKPDRAVSGCLLPKPEITDVVFFGLLPCSRARRSKGMAGSRRERFAHRPSDFITGER